MTMAFGGQLYPSQLLGPKDKASKTIALNIALRSSLSPPPTYDWDIPQEETTPTIIVTASISPTLPRLDPAQLHSFVTMGNAPSSVMDSLVEGSNCTFSVSTKDSRRSGRIKQAMLYPQPCSGRRSYPLDSC